MTDTPVDFVHIGLPKAASTWLQQCLFPQLSAVVLGAGDPQDAINQAFVAEVRTIVMSPEHVFDRDRFARRIDALFAAHRQTHPAPLPTPRLHGLSHEVLSGLSLTGRNAAFVARTLRVLYPQAKILLFIRNQRDMLISSYMQYIRMGGWAPFRSFLMDPAVSGESPDPGVLQNTLLVEYFKYSRLVELYRDLFGANLLVECMERLWTDRPATVERLRRFLDVPVPGNLDDRRTNVHFSSQTLAIMRHLNRLLKSRRHNPRGMIPDGCAVWLYRTLRPGHARAHPMADNPYMLSADLQHSLALRVAGRLNRLFDNRWIKRTGPDYFRTLPADYREWLFEEYRRDNRRTQALIETDLAAAGYLL
ncbi:MAG TPA: hypothetical protein ENN87_17555 [Phycisphaerales bacterium]|nr:hypothetical protein [Phycisphaerales bacterium]